MDARKLRRIKNNIRTCLTGQYVEGEIELDMLSKEALKRISHTKIRKIIKEKQFPPLSAEEKAEVDQIYKGYPFFTYDYHRVFKGLTGKFYPDYMPEDLYYCYIEDSFSDKEASRYIDNKCYYPRIFPNLKQQAAFIEGSTEYARSVQRRPHHEDCREFREKRRSFSPEGERAYGRIPQEHKKNPQGP